MEIINWVEREAQKLCGRSPYYIVKWTEEERRSATVLLAPPRDPLLPQVPTSQ